jgi:hypothetical protein
MSAKSARSELCSLVLELFGERPHLPRAFLRAAILALDHAENIHYGEAPTDHDVELRFVSDSVEQLLVVSDGGIPVHQLLNVGHGHIFAAFWAQYSIIDRSSAWCPRNPDGVKAEEPIALVGTGLTAVDLIVEARANGHRGVIYAISRHGQFPCCHRPSPATHHPQIPVPSESEATARHLLRRVRSEVALCEARGSDWRSVVDAFRPVTQTVELARNLLACPVVY